MKRMMTKTRRQGKQSATGPQGQTETSQSELVGVMIAIGIVRVTAIVIVTVRGKSAGRVRKRMKRMAEMRTERSPRKQRMPRTRMRKTRKKKQPRKKTRNARRQRIVRAPAIAI